MVTASDDPDATMRESEVDRVTDLTVLRYCEHSSVKASKACFPYGVYSQGFPG